MTSSKPRTKGSAGQTSAGTAAHAAESRNKSASSHESAALRERISQQERLQRLTDNFRFAEFFQYPENFDLAMSQLQEDLSEVPVLGDSGEVTNPYLKIESCPHLQAADKQLIWQCLAIVRHAFFRADGGASHGHGGYQWNMNWKHTRAEIDQVLECARLLQLDRDETRDAVIASIFSDAVKDRRNFITHNVDGAFGAAQVLLNFVDVNDPAKIAMIERVSQAVREHQIAPPEFMARAIGIMLSKKLRLPAFNETSCDLREATSGDTTPIKQQKYIHSIYRKVADPFNTAHLIDNLHRIDFTEAERELLAEIGIKEWYVPHPQNHDARIAHAVIAGDHSINYNHPEGFAKIALIRGPDTEAIFEDPTVHHSLDSAVTSFCDSFRVLLPEVQPMAMAGLRRTQLAVERVVAVMRELFSGLVVGPVDTCLTGADKVSAAIERAHDRKPDLFVARSNCLAASQTYTERAVERVGMILQRWLDEWGEIPYAPKDDSSSEPGCSKLPFWNTPLKYPARDGSGRMSFDSLTELERRQFFFAVNIRDIAVELLRAEQWIY